MFVQRLTVWSYLILISSNLPTTPPPPPPPHPAVKQGAGAPNSKHKNEFNIDIHQTQKQYGHRNNPSLPQEQSDYNDRYTGFLSCCARLDRSQWPLINCMGRKSREPRFDSGARPCCRVFFGFNTCADLSKPVSPPCAHQNNRSDGCGVAIANGIKRDRRLDNTNL